jgi:aspartyl-tRNA(Asn)/glutamyl-tRNA(Gln) amidotransferase subunit B
VADYYETTLAALVRLMPEGDRKTQAKAVSNFVMTEVLRVLNERQIGIEAFPIEPERLAALIRLRLEDRISSTGAQEIFNTMLSDARMPEEIAEAHNLLQVSDESALIPIVEAVLAENPDKVQTYLNGKTGLMGFFIGQVMRRFEGAPDPKRVRQLLEARLEAARSTQAS